VFGTSYHDFTLNDALHVFEVTLGLDLIFSNLSVEMLKNLTEVAHIDTGTVEQILHALRVSWHAISRLQVIDKGLNLVFLQKV
jgi:hypothetical protein